MSNNAIHVVVAVIYNSNNEILIARRKVHQHQGDKWEFPGGKVENRESSQQALIREIQEEVGIKVKSSELLTKIVHQYEDKKVRLDVYRVESWSGEASGLEGQLIRWIGVNELGNYQFPKANDEIISLIQLVS